MLLHLLGGTRDEMDEDSFAMTNFLTTNYICYTPYSTYNTMTMYICTCMYVYI